MTESKAKIRPVSLEPSASDVTSTAAPFATCPISCCGTVKFTYTGRSDCSETIGAPPARYCPRLISRSPRAPAKGARIVFRAMVARISPTRAVACLYVAAAVSYVSCDTILPASIPCDRLSSTRDSSCCASAAASCARSCLASSSTRTSPLFTD